MDVDTASAHLKWAQTVVKWANHLQKSKRGQRVVLPEYFDSYCNKNILLQLKDLWETSPKEKDPMSLWGFKTLLKDHMSCYVWALLELDQDVLLSMVAHSRNPQDYLRTISFFSCSRAIWRGLGEFVQIEDRSAAPLDGGPEEEYACLQIDLPYGFTCPIKRGVSKREILLAENFKETPEQKRWLLKHNFTKGGGRWGL